MAIDLSGGSFIDAFNKQEDRLLARRAKNRDIYDKMMTDATARGEKMTVEQITDLRTELSNGNNFFAGYVPRGEILQQNITRQNERASNVMDIENTARMKREDDERSYINNQADIFSDKSLGDFTTGMTGLLGERATELAEQNGGMETWWKNSRERKQTKLFQDPRVQNLMSEQEVDNQYGHLAPHLQNALKGFANTNARKDLQTRTTSAYGDIQNLPADILSVASQDPKSATAIAAKNTFVRSIISKYRLPEGEQGKLLQIVNDRIALGNTGYKKDTEDAFKTSLSSDAQMAALIGNDSDQSQIRLRAEQLASIANYEYGDSLDENKVWQAFTKNQLGRLKTNAAANWVKKAAATQATYIELAENKAEQAATNMAVALKGIKDDAESGDHPELLLAYTAVEQFAGAGYIPSDANAAVADAKALAKEAIAGGMEPDAARTAIVNALISRGGTTTKAGMVASKMSSEIQRRHGIEPGTHIGYEGDNGAYDKTMETAKSLKDKLAKYMLTVPSNRPERADAQKTAAINNLKKIVSFIRDQVTENGHQFKGTKADVNDQASNLAREMSTAIAEMEAMQASADPTNALPSSATALHRAANDGDPDAVIDGMRTPAITGNSVQQQSLDRLEVSVTKLANKIKDTGPSIFENKNRGQVDSEISALASAIWNKNMKPSFITQSQIKDKLYMQLFGALSMTSKGISYKLSPKR